MPAVASSVAWLRSALAVIVMTVESRSGPESVKDLDALTDHLKKQRDSAENKQAIKVQGDSKLKWKWVVRVMDACRKAGFENISFVPPPDYQLGT